MPTKEQVHQALTTVLDPEIGKPITDLDMVKEITVDGSNVIVEVLLTVAGCPLKDRITRDVTNAVKQVDGVAGVEVVLGVMTEEQRQAMVTKLRGGQGQAAERPIEFWQEGTRTRAILVASGKGGVGKSSVTANLAVALAQKGYKVGLVDADFYGFSQPTMLGATGRPTTFNGMALPIEAHGVKLISIGFLVAKETPVIWRGPMLHKLLQQFLADVYWGEIDYVVIDMPPGTGDVAISVSQYLPGAEMVVVTTPQEAASSVAARAGAMTDQANLKVLGVIENMSYFICSGCNEKHYLFGTGGGEQLAAQLNVDLLGQIPMDQRLREGADEGKPVVLTDPDSPAAAAIAQIAEKIAKKGPSIVGRKLPMAMGPSSGGGGHRH